MRPLPMSGVLGLSGAVLLAVAGCARLPAISNPLEFVTAPATIHVDAPVKPASVPLLRSGQPIVLLVSDFTDARSISPSRKVGDVRATVSNMHGSELVLDQEVPALVSTAVKNQLGADGFRLANSLRDAHDFKLSGIIKAFSLDIAGRDELNIAVEATLRDAKSGEVVWAGVVTEKSDRFAGVTGNSRSSIAAYLGEGLSEIAAKTSASIRDSLARAYSQTISSSQAKSISSLPGVTTLQSPAVRETPSAVEKPRATAAVGGGTGYFSISTVPSRAKVYVDDVYYGMSPLKLELEPGINLFRFKLDGYKTVTEKVSVRRGETTELEVKFEK